MDEGDRIEAAFGKLCADGFGIDGLSPLDLDCLRLVPAFFRDIDPLVGERAAAEAENLIADEIAEGSFHHAPCGGCGEKNGACGAEDLFQSGL